VVIKYYYPIYGLNPDETGKSNIPGINHIYKEERFMYEGGKGAGPVGIAGGAILLPNTGGHIILTIVAITSITVGAAITLSILARWIAKRAYTKA